MTHPYVVGMIILNMQATIESNKQDMKTNEQECDEKMINLTEEFKSMLTSSITSMMDQINKSKSSPDKKDPPNPQDPTNMVPANRRDSPLDG